METDTYKVRAQRNLSDIVFFIFFYSISPERNTYETRLNFFLDAQFFFNSLIKILSLFCYKKVIFKNLFE